MALTLGDNFSYQGAKPLDARLKYSTVAEMKAVADATMYDGCLAYCTATEKTYQWKSTNTVDASTGRWREFSSGGGGAEIDDATTASDKVWSSQKIDTTKLNKVLAQAVKIAGADVTDIASAITSLAGIARILTITKNTFGQSASDNFNSANYGTKGAVKAYHYLWEAGNSFNNATGVPQWFTYPSYDVNYLLITYRNEEDTFIDEFAYCFYTESSVAKVRHYARRATKSGSTWTFPAWTEVGSLPVATSSVLGGVKIGENMTIEDGVINPSYLVVANKFNKADLYSTTEKVVGCWTDGRPLYQRTFTGTTPNCTTDGTKVQSTISMGCSVSEFVDIRFRVRTTNDLQIGEFQNSPIAIATNNTFVGIRVSGIPNSASSDQNKLSISNTATAFSNKTYYITVQYTKTTDSANSFKYADENDYSTSEKIVGSWIDGKPVYQRTLDLTSKTLATGRNEFDLTSYLGSSLNKIWLISDMSTVFQGSTEITPSLVAWSSSFNVTTQQAQSLFVFMNGTKPYLVFQQTLAIATKLGYVTLRYTKS